MKTIKMLSLDVELVEKLKAEKNASKLVNELLEDYYGTTRENIKRKKFDIDKAVNELDIEEKQLKIVEDEQKKQKILREHTEKEYHKKKVEYEKERIKLKNKKLPFEEFLIESRKLKEKWGIK